MFNICIIGFGNIGKRHFEALLKLNVNANVYLIDTYELAFNNINSYNIGSNFNVKYSCDYSYLPDELDLTIIATSSDIRRNCFEKLISCCKVKNIIFEKVLFQKVEDYEYVENELSIRGISAWVNCARRYIQSYINLKDRIKNLEIRNINISGSNWGLGSNGIHMLDLISYMLNDTSIDIDCCKFEKMIDSKRKGFKDFYGRISGATMDNKTKFIISCDDSKNDLKIQIECEDESYIILEKDRQLIKITKSNIVEKFGFEMEYISSITTKAVYDILKKNECLLTTYSKSKELHLLFIKGIINYFENNFGEKGICPIT